MFDDLEEARADRALRAGLAELPVPEASADFDARIFAALQPAPPFWHTCWLAVRPAIPGAACGLAIMLLLIRFTQQAATSPSALRAAVSISTPFQRLQGGDSRANMPTEESMDDIDLTSPSLSFLSHPAHRPSRKRG